METMKINEKTNKKQKNKKKDKKKIKKRKKRKIKLVYHSCLQKNNKVHQFTTVSTTDIYV